jgi:trimethylamine:corrinoid methyltransferase-like protein
MHMLDEFYESGLADRSHYEEWTSAGRRDMKTRAREKLEALMSSHNPCYINDPELSEIRSRFPEIRD